MKGAEIGALRREERAAATAVLARAFRDNPLNLAVMGASSADRRLRANAVGTRVLLPVAQAHGLVRVARLEGSVAAVLIAAPPFAYPLPPPSLRARLACLLGQGWRVSRRWAEAFDRLDALHPADPHWYLGTLGVEPALHGRGLGTALLRHWLEGVDRDARPAYLETDLARNLDFYRRAGFEVEREAEVLGARVWCMQRPASGG